MKMSGIVLSASVRQNLLSLQSTAELLSTTQNRLATGKKVNTALDNPTNFFTAASLDNRASDISNLLDSIGNGVQVLQAANTGITSLQKLVDSAKIGRQSDAAGRRRLFGEVERNRRCDHRREPPAIFAALPPPSPTTRSTGAAIPGAALTTTKLSAFDHSHHDRRQLYSERQDHRVRKLGRQRGRGLRRNPRSDQRDCRGILLGAVDTITGASRCLRRLAPPS